MSDFKITTIIEKKRNSEKLTKQDIKYFVDFVVKSNIDRAQIGAMLMAVYLKGLDPEETSELTETMTNSGYVFSWPKEWRHLVVDKHSTGGVGDKVSLVLAPALAAVGLKVPMISGRSLGHTGGTLDKLESIPGFRVDLSKEEIYETVSSVGCCIVGQNEDCAPADRILYHCREITATVTCPPLIIASIVSKKLCEGIAAIVYDVKYGKGSVFSSKKEAHETAENLFQFSRDTKASFLLTSMENPLGRAIGNSNEVCEAIHCLRATGPDDVLMLTLALGSELLCSVQGTHKDEGKRMIGEVIKNGMALKKFHDMIISQGVAAETAKELCYGKSWSVLPKAQHQTDIFYDGENGYVEEINPLTLANICKQEHQQSNNHPGVGLYCLKTVEDEIKKGDAWLRVFHQKEKLTDEVLAELRSAISVQESRKKRVLIDACYNPSMQC